MGKRRRKKRRGHGRPTCDRDELVLMHGDVLARWRIKGAQDCSSATYSLLGALSACMGNWPRVKRTKVEELRQRYNSLMDRADREVSLGGRGMP